MLKSSGNKTAAEILSYEEQISYIENQQKELSEAICAGEAAFDTASHILGSLDKAESWANWDMFGGGVVFDMIKHEHLDNAQEEVETLQIQLQRFKTELNDVMLQADFQVNIDGFLRFADYFFDGLFVDWAVLSKIQNSQYQLQQTIEQITDILHWLKSSLESSLQKHKQLKDELERLIYNSKIPQRQE